MKRLHTTLVMLVIAITTMWAVDFEKYFVDNALRVDISVRNWMSDDYSVSIDSIAQWPGWYGRRVNLDKVFFPEDMEIVVIDAATHDTIYIDTKSPNALSEEDRGLPAYIQMLVPKPKDDCEIVANLYGYGPEGRELSCSASRKLSARQLSEIKMNNVAPITPYRVIRTAKDPKHCVNLTIVAEGYRPAERELFYRRATQLDSALFTQPAFNERTDAFNVVAVMLPSEESGISIPSANVTVNSALKAHFDSFGLERLVTIPDTKPLWDALEGIPVSHVMILANTEKYGGSGAYNEYAISSAELPHFTEILIHEFGHSFTWLGDEYESGYTDEYTSDFEPLEPNITTLHDFSGKWQNLIDSGEAGLIEGAGYQEKGVWRGCEHCLMRAIEDQKFCVVCAQALKRTIDFYTQQQ